MSSRTLKGSILIWHSNSCEKDSRKGFITLAIVNCFPDTWDRDVTPLSGIPQGTMCENHVRSLFTFNARPCVVIYRLPCTPIKKSTFSNCLETSYKKFYTNGTQLFIFDPYSSVWRLTSFYTKWLTQLYNGFFQLANIPLHAFIEVF